MQSTAISFSPSVPLLRKPNSIPAREFSNPISLPSLPKLPARFRPLSTSGFSSKGLVRGPIRCSASDSASVNPVRSGWISGPAPEPECDDGLKVRAASVPETAGEKPEGRAFRETLVLGTLFGLWYLFNIYFNIYNKQVTLFY